MVRLNKTHRVLTSITLKTILQIDIQVRNLIILSMTQEALI